MAWTVRYRVRVSKPLTSDATELTLVIGGREALVSGEGNKPLKESNWLTLNIHGLENEDAAREFGRRVALAVLLAGARQDVGIDAGENRATSGFGKIVADEVAGQSGKLLPNVHGLYIYEREGNEVFFHMSANGRVTTDPSMFLNGMASSFDETPGLGEREQTALALIALSNIARDRLPRPRYVSRRWNTVQPMRHGRMGNLSCLLSCKRRLPLPPNCPKMKPRKSQKRSDASSRPAYANPSNER